MNDLPGGFAVVGGGISGLAAAWDLSRAGRVTVYDPEPLGGKLITETFDGRPVDIGPDAFLTRVPDAVGLCHELGLDDELVAPTTGQAMLWTRRGLVAMPDGLVLGTPRRLGGLWHSSLFGPAAVGRAGLDLVLPRRRDHGDVSVHDLVARRFGEQVAVRLVGPLVGGIHAGHIDELSARATTPQLVAAAERSRSLIRALAATPEAGDDAVFLTPRLGLGRLVGRLVEALGERDVAFVSSSVRRVRPADRDRVVVQTEAGEAAHGGAVLAVAADRAATILADRSPAGLRGIPTASVSLVLMRFDARELHPPSGISGFLVPAATGRLMTACSFASTKWPHWAAPGSTLLRVSAGRAHDLRARSMGDEELTERLTAEVNQALGGRATPTAVRVSRWPDSFPQYVVGHLDTVDDIDRQIARLGSPVALAGASYRGAGIPACIASGRRAAATVIAATRRACPGVDR